MQRKLNCPPTYDFLTIKAVPIKITYVNNVPTLIPVSLSVDIIKM